MSLLKLSDLTIGYEGRAAVSNVSFELNAGDYLCIVGENGSGKSTLIKGILGLVKPQSGSVAWQGIQRREAGYVPQQTQVQRDFPASVHEVVLSGCLNRSGLKPYYTKVDRERAAESICLLGMEEFSAKSYRALSGGQQRRVLLARALCATQKLLILDEPAAGLDPMVTAELYALMEKLNKERGVTVMMVSHDIQSAVRFASKILHMQTKALFFGTPAEYQKTAICRRMLGVDDIV